MRSRCSAIVSRATAHALGRRLLAAGAREVARERGRRAAEHELMERGEQAQLGDRLRRCRVAVEDLRDDPARVGVGARAAHQLDVQPRAPGAFQQGRASAEEVADHGNAESNRSMSEAVVPGADGGAQQTGAGDVADQDAGPGEQLARRRRLGVGPRDERRAVARRDLAAALLERRRELAGERRGALVDGVPAGAAEHVERGVRRRRSSRRSARGRRGARRSRARMRPGRRRGRRG